MSKTAYSGPLTAESASEGVTAALENARELLEDARLLLDHHRWPRATALALLAIEEAGKGFVIRAILCARDDAARREEWRAYRNHTTKNVLAAIGACIKPGAKLHDLRLRDFRQLFGKGAREPRAMDLMKQAGFYTDCLDRSHWTSPSKEIDEHTARAFVGLAGMLVRDSVPAFSTPLGLKIFEKHVKGADLTKMPAPPHRRL